MRRLFGALLPLLLLGAAPAPLPVEQPEVVATFPHDSTAFTEGLIYLDGRLFESTGLEGQSVVREVRLEDGKVLREAAIDARYFGEGLVDWRYRLNVKSPKADIVFYETPKGGAVFSVGSMGWRASLNHNDFKNSVSKMTGNVLRRFANATPFEGVK